MADAKLAILTAARNCIAASGVRGLRVTDVAAEADVSPGLLYYHFGDRAGLLAATLEFIDTGARAIGARDEPPTALGLLLGEIRDDTEVRRNSVAWNELRSVAVFETSLGESLATTTAIWNGHIADAITADAASESRNPDSTTIDPADAAEILTSLVEGLSGRWLSGSLDAQRSRELVRITFSALVRG